MAASPGSQKPNSTAQKMLTGNSRIMPPMPASMITPANTCIGTLVLGLRCFVSAFVFDAAAQQGYYPGLAVLLFLALDFLVLAVLATAELLTSLRLSQKSLVRHRKVL